MSTPVRAYLTAHKDERKAVAWFCTLGGSGASKVLAEMAALCAREPVATLAITDADIERGRYGGALDEFVGTVGRHAG
jgi:hypothetical protein